MIVELIDMVEEGLDRKHYRQLLWQIRAKGTICREVYDTREAQEDQTEEEEHGRQVHPADVIALQGNAVEQPSRRASPTNMGDLMMARQRLRRVLEFLEQPLAQEVREALQAMDRWLAAWSCHGGDRRQERGAPTAPSRGTTRRDTESRGGRTREGQRQG